MPIYEYTCEECGTAFEELVRGDSVVVCPRCGSSNVRRLLSAFAVHSSSGGGGRSCSTCAATSCSTCH